jgi:hypothetical protein
MNWYKNYLSNVAQTPNESWNSLVQETINSSWEDTTQIRKIKEQSYPFSNEYEEYDVWVSTVSDVSINYQKVIGDFISVLFKDCNHKLNVRGQKYLYAEDGINEQIYLCYDKINPLNQTATFKAIRCNNYIKWINKSNGDIIQEPIFVGYEMTANNSAISREGTISQRRLVCIIQGNEETKKIKENQRFILNHNKAFKVTEINNVIMNDINNDESVTMLTMYIEWTSILPQDNIELNIADYYSNNYSIKIDQNEIEQLRNYKGKLSATVKYNDNIIDMPLKWISDNVEIVTIDEQGNYQLIGESGSTSSIKCYIDGNDDIYDEIQVKIVENYLGEKIIQITPIINELKQNRNQEFTCGVYINGDRQKDLIVCQPNWVDDKYYVIEETIDGYKLTNKQMSNKELQLTFTSGSCEPVIMNIKLKGVL